LRAPEEGPFRLEPCRVDGRAVSKPPIPVAKTLETAEPW
jgi:hypothetical protein